MKVYFDDDECDIDSWGKNKGVVQEEALKRSSHGVLVVTPTLLRRGVESAHCLLISNAMLQRMHEKKCSFFLLLVGVERREFDAVFPLYAKLRLLKCREGRDVSEAADKIFNLIMSSNAIFRGGFLTNYLFHAETENLPESACIAPSPINHHFSGDRKGPLPLNIFSLIGLKEKAARILKKFSCRSPSASLCWIRGQQGIGKSHLAAYVAHKVREMNWTVIFVRTRHLESETDLCLELLLSMQTYLGKDKQIAESKGSLLSKVLKLLEKIDKPCIILDGCDRALAAEKRCDAFRFVLQEILKAHVHKPFMILVTSCQELKFWSLPDLEISLHCLEKDKADNLLISCVTEELQQVLKSSTIASIRELCLGVPMLIRMAGAALSKLCRAPITQEELVKKLRAKPLNMVSPTAIEAFVINIYNLIPSSLKLLLHGISLFIGSFTRVEGAKLLGLSDGVQFSIDVIGPLQEYFFLARSSENDVSPDQTQYHLHSLIRNVLLQLDFRTSEFKEIQDRFAVMQLGCQNTGET